MKLQDTMQILERLYIEDGNLWLAAELAQLRRKKHIRLVAHNRRIK